jgi:hypothetical protein
VLKQNFGWPDLRQNSYKIDLESFTRPSINKLGDGLWEILLAKCLSVFLENDSRKIFLGYNLSQKFSKEESLWS